MLIELKRCNTIGNIKGVLFLVSIMAGKEKVGKDEIRNRCALENEVAVNCPGAIAFFEYLGLIETTSDTVMPTAELNSLTCSDSEIINHLVISSINKLVEEGIFDKDTTGFDTESGHLTIKRSAFPLDYAAIRNFLTMAGALDREENGEICVASDYESNWTEQLRNRRKRCTLEQLLKEQEEQSRRGLEAEEFVLKVEKERLPEKARKIKRISDFDVAAGYDIVSYENVGIEHYDRFIEVKCYIGEPHFYWSENEVDVARVKGEKYLLCLVDYLKIGEEGYCPEYIRNPYEKIFSGEEWLLNTASYRVQKI